MGNFPLNKKQLRELEKLHITAGGDMTWHEIVNSDEWVKITGGITDITSDALRKRISRLRRRREEGRDMGQHKVTGKKISARGNKGLGDEQVAYDALAYGNKTTARLHGITESAVRGMKSRHLSSAKGRVGAIDDVIQRAYQENGDALAIQSLIRRHRQAFIERRESLNGRKDYVVAAFVSDIHFPHHHRSALELLYICLEILNPDWVTSGNDILDFPNLSRWEDRSSGIERAWNNDISSTLEVLKIHHSTIQDIAPNTRGGGLPYLESNHTIRLINALLDSSSNNPFASMNLLQYFESLERQGVTVMTSEYHREQFIRLTSNLKWVHGVSASSNNTTVAKNTIKAGRGKDVTGDANVYYNTVAGHTHRPFIMKVADYGVSHANAPCLCQRNVNYQKHGNSWELGFVYSKSSTSGSECYHDLVLFKVEGNGDNKWLVARDGMGNEWARVRYNDDDDGIDINI